MDPYELLKLDNQICFPLYALSREIIKLYTPLLDPHDLTYTQYVTLMVLWEYETIPFKELARRLHLDSGTLTPVLRKLEARQLVTKHRNPEDDRTVTVVLTDQGRALREDLLEVPCRMAALFKGQSALLEALKANLETTLTLLEMPQATQTTQKGE